MDHGSVLVEGTPRELIAALGGEHVVEFDSTWEIDDAQLKGLPAVSRVDRTQSRARLTTAEPHRTIPALYQLIERAQGELTELNTHHATLDDVFLALTGRQLRDE
jgi:ABC-2 type transport system ATP-binding protein